MDRVRELCGKVSLAGMQHLQRDYNRESALRLLEAALELAEEAEMFVNAYIEPSAVVEPAKLEFKRASDIRSMKFAGVDTKSCRIVSAYSVETVGDMADLDPRQFTSLEFVGIVTIGRIKERLAAYGIKLHKGWEAF